MDDKKRIALDTISEAAEQYGCRKVYCLYSGGDDSTAALLTAREHPLFVAAVHCNTPMCQGCETWAANLEEAG